jgi:hypothetical protein
LTKEFFQSDIEGGELTGVVELKPPDALPPRPPLPFACTGFAAVIVAASNSVLVAPAWPKVRAGLVRPATASIPAAPITRFRTRRATVVDPNPTPLCHALFHIEMHCAGSRGPTWPETASEEPLVGLLVNTAEPSLTPGFAFHFTEPHTPSRTCGKKLIRWPYRSQSVGQKSRVWSSCRRQFRSSI